MKKKMILIAMVSVLAVAAIFAKGGTESGASSPTTAKNYIFGGSSTIAPVINSAIPVFEASNPGVKVSYETLGSSVGITQLQEGTLSLAGSSRDLKLAELDAGLIPITVALDGLSVAVNASVSISNLTMAQLAAIFAGEITNWKDVGGQDGKIELIVRDETSGTYASFKEIVLDTQKKVPSVNAIVARENGELAAKIASTPNSIGYIGMAFNHIITEAGGKVLTVDGVEPNSTTVKSGEYPISRALYMVSKGTLQPSVEKDFVDFLLSTRGQAIVLENEFIPLN